ncbi:hypothetical protein DL765_004165 [Monosporascus sp. GIB2]|nr:hypothetical protein DL765_004165 [Monosporascus sp. GIB2]
MSPICRVKFPQVGDGETTGRDAVAWANRIIEAFSGGEAAVFDSPSLPDLTVAIEDSDTAELLVSPRDSIPYSISDPASQYPARFRIPPSTLRDLPEEECKKRAQRFAVGSLIYTSMHGKPPFADLDEGIVQQNFENGVYPVETMSFPQGIAIAILGFWSQEFAEAIMELSAHKDQTSLPGKMLKYMKANPVGTIGLGVCGVASLISPALGIAGFSAVGPTAGTAAAAWQSSIGLVQAGSFFAWCQSAAMGGAAAGAIGATQGVGAVIATLGAILGWSTAEKEAMRKVWSLFTEKMRKRGEGDSDREKGEWDSDTEVEDGVEGSEQDSSKGVPPRDTAAKL